MLAGVFGIAGGFIAGRLLSKPITKLADAAHAVGAGDRSIDAPGSGIAGIDRARVAVVTVKLIVPADPFEALVNGACIAVIAVYRGIDALAVHAFIDRAGIAVVTGNRCVDASYSRVTTVRRAGVSVIAVDGHIDTITVHTHILCACVAIITVPGGTAAVCIRAVRADGVSVRLSLIHI